ncbi:hypothetical protein THAOC_34618 [Thalassiosira oceanica]|uniref:5'-nucleotidase domain-containing protein n=1 Tax=Thalassiosira oceanica TaxID=159749 RepID=K0R387_THAOC|nr:hypothetical protein THAOC_34618 [Thalassiosira oceanica]|eukprot:EJK46700.1 hypothetical protein THAOC_34618 [Thalassiosira oceanica]
MPWPRWVSLYSQLRHSFLPLRHSRVTQRQLLGGFKSQAMRSNVGQDVVVPDDDESSTPTHAAEYGHMTTLPRHTLNEEVNVVLAKTEIAIRNMQENELFLASQKSSSAGVDPEANEYRDCEEIPLEVEKESVYANSYIDLGKVDTVGFDYDYTLVTYTEELLELIYDMALKRLVDEKEYPREMLESGLKFDPRFSIRGLAVDRENGWVCHLSYTHKVAAAWEGRHRVDRKRLMGEYSGKRALTPSQRRKRLRPLNDLFSMAECCLMADTVQFFLDREIPFCARSAVTDVLGAITGTHISGDFHRQVANDPERYFEPKPHLKTVLSKMKASGKRLIFVSNSPFWYCDAGMKYVVGDDWRDQWDVVIASAGKPLFYTESNRPFREVAPATGKVKFKEVTTLEKGRVYTSGCLKELTKCINWSHPLAFGASDDSDSVYNDIFSPLMSPNVLYIGDSLFADLVDAKREFGWTTAAVTPEVGWEIELQRKAEFVIAEKAIELLLNSLRLYQRKLGTDLRTEEDLAVMDKLERLISKWRDEQTRLMGNPFGSIFRARYTPSLFSHSLRRYCDLYMSNVASLRHYSPQHRFYPETPKLLSHEIRGSNPECCEIDDDFFC